MELIFSTNAGGKVVSMPKMIPIFFTNTPSSGNTNPAFARLPSLLEIPTIRVGSNYQPLYILTKKRRFVSERPLLGSLSRRREERAGRRVRLVEMEQLSLLRLRRTRRAIRVSEQHYAVEGIA